MNKREVNVDMHRWIIKASGDIDGRLKWSFFVKFSVFHVANWMKAIWRFLANAKCKHNRMDFYIVKCGTCDDTHARAQHATCLNLVSTKRCTKLYATQATATTEKCIVITGSCQHKIHKQVNAQRHFIFKFVHVWIGRERDEGRWTDWREWE